MSADTSIEKSKGTQTLSAMLEARKDFLISVLPASISPSRLIKVSLLARSRNPLLLQCTHESLLKAILQSAELGLEPTGAGGVHLVPFKNNKTGNYEVTVIPDYRGLMELARRSGAVAAIEARSIHEKDEYDVQFGSEPILKHRPNLKEESAMIAVYSVAVLVNGIKQIEVMTKDAIDRIRSRSRAAQSGPWVTDYEAMAKKTVIKQLCKYLPRGIDARGARQMQDAIDLDDSFEADVTPSVEMKLPEDIKTKAMSKTETVKSILREQP